MTLSHSTAQHSTLIQYNVFSLTYCTVSELYPPTKQNRGSRSSGPFGTLDTKPDHRISRPWDRGTLVEVPAGHMSSNVYGLRLSREIKEQTTGIRNRSMKECGSKVSDEQFSVSHCDQGSK